VKLADDQRKEVLKRNLEDPPKPLFDDMAPIIPNLPALIIRRRGLGGDPER
jgi:hypothetical protein